MAQMLSPRKAYKIKVAQNCGLKIFFVTFFFSCFQAVPFDNWRILRGDRVQVISGKNKVRIFKVFFFFFLSFANARRWSQGLRGEVKQVIRSRNQVIVEGVNLVKKHQAGSGEMQGGIFTKEAPLAVSTVSLIDPSDNRPCKTRWVFLENGEKERQSKRTSLLIPKNELVLKSRVRPISEGPLDTSPEETTKITFSPDEIIPKLNFNLAKKKD
jgi:large subunit ribosomal protein L24